MGKRTGWILTILLISGLTAWAQNFYRQGISFKLVQPDGTAISRAALDSGQVRIYSLREAKVAKDQQLTYNPGNQRFTFTESVISPGIALALVSPTDTMYLTVFGRSNADRVIDGIVIRKGSYFLTSNEFSGKYLKPENWENYLEDEVPATKQDLSSYVHQLKDKKPVSLVEVK